MGSRRRRSAHFLLLGKATVEDYGYVGRGAFGSPWGSGFDPMRYNSQMTAKGL